jgi:hypothetical protein
MLRAAGYEVKNPHDLFHEPPPRIRSRCGVLAAGHARRRACAGGLRSHRNAAGVGEVQGALLEHLIAAKLGIGALPGNGTAVQCRWITTTYDQASSPYWSCTFAPFKRDGCRKLLMERVG